MIGARVRVALANNRGWSVEDCATINNVCGTIEKTTSLLYRVRFDTPITPWWRDTAVEWLWFSPAELVVEPPDTSAGVRVHLRAPKIGERGWWVEDVSSPLAAMREVFRECCTISDGDVGWLAHKNHEWKPDEHNMYPVTLEVL